MGTAIKHPLPDRVKPSFVILTSGHFDAEPWASECPNVKNYKWRLNPGAQQDVVPCTLLLYPYDNSGRQSDVLRAKLMEFALQDTVERSLRVHRCRNVLKLKSYKLKPW